MTGRVTLEIVAILAVATVISGSILALFALTDSVDPVGTLVDQVPRVLFGLLGLAWGLWLIMLIIGAIAHRYRGVGWRIGTHIVSLAVALIINVLVVSVASFIGAGGSDWELLIVGILVAVSGVLFFSGVVAVLVVELLIVRPRQMMRDETVSAAQGEHPSG